MLPWSESSACLPFLGQKIFHISFSGPPEARISRLVAASAAFPFQTLNRNT